MTDPRQKPFDIQWSGDDLIGRIRIDGELWAAVEWSEKRQCWCIEDSQGRCLRHTKHIQGSDKDKATAVALAEAMIRDGRMPDPATALRNRQAEMEHGREQRKKRLQQPAEIRKRKEEDRVHKLMSAKYEAEWREQREETPFYEALADAFDFVDPELWKSNSFASLRPRIVVSVKTAIAGFEFEIAQAALDSKTQPFAMYASKERRQAAMKWRQEECAKTIAKFQTKLDRAREILKLLEES
jgi:xanthine/CO dehydrogenase XdhC/CoxF family maturation factor